MSGSKKFKGMKCVYCRKANALTADHVFPREMFQVHQRGNLPKVPSCFPCNNKKSRLEHYLLAVLPFGATHPSAHQALQINVTKRLRKNRKLHNEIKRNMSFSYIPSRPDVEERFLTVAFDGEVMHEYVGYVGRGLMWHHWRKYLPLECDFLSFTPSKTGLTFLDYLFGLSTQFRVLEELGNGTVRYRGALLSEGEDCVSVWAIQLLGGMTVSSENHKEIFANSFVAMVSGSPKMLAQLDV